MKEDLEHRSLRGLHETPSAWREHEGVPGCDGERANEEVLVRAQMRREVERIREEVSDVGHVSNWTHSRAAEGVCECAAATSVVR